MKRTYLFSIFALSVTQMSAVPIHAGEGSSIGTAGGGNIPSIAAIMPREIEFYWSRTWNEFDSSGREIWLRGPHQARIDLSRTVFEAALRIESFGAPPELRSEVRLTPQPGRPRPTANADDALGRVTEVQIWIDGGFVSLEAFAHLATEYRRALLGALPENPLEDAEVLNMIERFETHFFSPFRRVVAPNLLVYSGLDAHLIQRLSRAFAPVFPELAMRASYFLSDQLSSIERQINQVIDRTGRCSLTQYAALDAQMTALASNLTRILRSRVHSFERVERQTARARRIQSIFENTIRRACQAGVDPTAPRPPQGIQFSTE